MMKTLLLAATIMAFNLNAAIAATTPDKELGLLLGAGYVDGDMAGKGADNAQPILGVRYGQRLGTTTNFFSDLTYTDVNGKRAKVGDGSLLNLRGGLEWLFSQQERYNWFLSGGLGAIRVNTDEGPDFTRPLLSFGLGQSWAVGTNDAFRWEVRADQSFGNGDLPTRTGNSGLTNVQALLGYSWGFGAPADADGDGVADRVDQCPGTPKRAKINAQGCPLDTDGDGVYDGLDKCPGTPPYIKVNSDGCPVDSDGDGLTDDKDKCPTVSAPGTVDGCPRDSDGDGVIDLLDKCPTVPAPGTADGCPRDSDGDGVIDLLDKCPTVPAPGTADGCPRDSDGDGVIDTLDKCPTVPAPGTADGCPVQAPAAVVPHKLVLEGVNFDNDQTTLRPDAYISLDAVAADLNEWGNVKVEVAGHTDSIGDEAYNLTLSQRRADTVREYLISKGVAADRLTAKGYGETQPVADNDTEEGRFKNRRVELVPLP